MEKRLYFDGRDSNGSAVVEALRFEEGHVKTASLKTARLHPDLAKYIDSLRPETGKLYVLVYALGAYEYWGANLNSDAVYENVLRNEDPNNGYRSFLNAGVYCHHDNQNPSKSIGRITISIYNPKMHRVELLIEIDRQRAQGFGQQDLLDQLDRGEHPPVSMGLRTPYDVCSICDNKAKLSDEYCTCLKVPGGMRGRILPDGRKVCMVNPVARFFDLSFVLIGADPAAFAVAKVAEFLGTGQRTSAKPKTHGTTHWVTKEAALKVASTKYAELEKRLMAMEAFQESEPSLPLSLLNDLGKCQLPSVLASTAGAGIMLKPHEFQRVALIRLGKSELADRLDDENACFHCGDRGTPDQLFSEQDLNPLLAQALAQYIPGRSLFAPALTARFEEPKVKIIRISISGPDPVFPALSAAYGSYRKGLAGKIDNFAQQGALQLPHLLSKLFPESTDIEGVLRGHQKIAGPEKQITLFGVLPALYLLTHLLQKGSGDPRPTHQKLVEDHPNISASVLRGLLMALT